jgi:hypothetical protein
MEQSIKQHFFKLKTLLKLQSPTLFNESNFYTKQMNGNYREVTFQLKGLSTFNAT